MQYVSFEETIGVYDGDQSVVDSCLSYVYDLQKVCPESDGNSNYGGWQKDIDHPIKQVILREFKKYVDQTLERKVRQSKRLPNEAVAERHRS